MSTTSSSVPEHFNKTSESQLRASKKYYKTHPETIKKIYKKYYTKNSTEIKKKMIERRKLLTPEQRSLKRQNEYAKNKAKRAAAKLEKKMVSLLVQQSTLIAI